MTIRRWTCGVLWAFLAMTGALGAQDNAAPASADLDLYHVKATKTGNPQIDEGIKFLEALLKKLFPQFDTFKLLDQTGMTLKKDETKEVKSAGFTNKLKLAEFKEVKPEKGDAYWTAKVDVTVMKGDNKIIDIQITLKVDEFQPWMYEPKDNQSGHAFVLKLKKFNR